jgi:hypothetical protein
MLIGYDTCFLLRIKDLNLSIGLDFRPILNHFRWITTAALKKEFEYYGLDQFISTDQIFIPLSISERETMIERYQLQSFDYADQDLVILGKRDNILIVTDDRDLSFQCKALRIPTFFTWTFLLQWVRTDLISKHQFSKCLKYWDQEKRYDKNTLKFMKSELDSIT